MVAIRRILCPTDYSAYSQAALGLALGLARRHGAGLLVLNVAPARVERDSAEFSRFIAPARGAGVAVEGVQLQGDVVTLVLERAQTWPADLIVMGTHGQREGRGWDIGSVTERVLRRSSSPVLIVARPTNGSGATTTAPFSRILCPSDFSEVSDRALEYALCLAQESRARMTLLHVLEWFPEQGEFAHLTIPEYHLDLSEAARDRLRLALPPEARGRCQSEELVASGRPHREILRVARERGVDLIVLGVHGQRALDRSLAGATVCHVVRETQCPVLAVRGRREAEGWESTAPAW